MRENYRYLLHEHLLLNEGAYFYRKGLSSITKKDISKLFDTVVGDVKHKVWESLICREYKNVYEGFSAFVSLLIFSSSNYPSFLDNNIFEVPTQIQEQKLSYLLIVDIDSYVVIIKKNVSHLSSFLNSLQTIDGQVLGDILVAYDTAFQQIKLTNMNVNEGAMRNKMYEANNLENTMPMFGSTQNIVTTARFSSNNELCTLNIRTSRIAKFGNKKDLQTILAWISDIVQRINNYSSSQNSFLKRFALPLKWKNVSNTLTPTSLMINVFELQNYFTNQLQDQNIYRRDKQGNEKLYTNLVQRVVSKGVRCLQLNVSVHALSDYTSITIPSLGVRKSALGLRVVARANWDELYYKNNSGNEVKLISLINELACFSIGFDKCDYIYMGRRIYQNGNITSDLDAILSVFIPISALSTVRSEKGSVLPNLTNFDTDSIFSVVENNICRQATQLVCDDMGNEWADHIAIQKDTISFLHSKYADTVSLSASNLQIVIGQAIKNIGNVNAEKSVILKKQTSLIGYWNKTKIDKCRKGTVRDFISQYITLQRRPNRIREVCLVVNFISKNDLQQAFNRFKNHASAPYYLVQMIWLLNGFISICKEADLHCKIYCCP